MLVAAAVGTWGLHAYPISHGRPVSRRHRGAAAGRAPRAGLRAMPRSGSRRRSSPRRSRLARWPSSRIDRHRGCVRAAPAVPSRVETRPTPSLVLGEAHFVDHARPRAGTAVAHDSAARPLHRRDGPRRRRHRQDVRLHVSRTSTSSCAGARRRPGAQGRRPGAGGEGRLLPAGADHARRAPAGPTTTSRSGSTPASATTRCTTISIRMRWPTPSPRC